MGLLIERELCDCGAASNEGFTVVGCGGYLRATAYAG